ESLMVRGHGLNRGFRFAGDVYSKSIRLFMIMSIQKFPFLLALLAVLTAFPARAQSVIRDAEIEADLRVIADPIFDAAGLNPSQVRIVLLDDDSINAFVAGGQNLFLYTGLILE